MIRWEKFLVNTFFDVSTTKGVDKNKIQIEDNAPYDFVGRTSVNWGIQGTIQKLDFEPNPKNSFSLVQVGESVALWREREWYASQNLFLLKPKFEEIVKNPLFFQTCINKEMAWYGKDYSRYPTMKSLSKTNISLPILLSSSNQPIIDETCRYHKDGYIPDWKYMQETIKELEQERIKELEQYLIVTGLNDYELTEEDKEVLNTKLFDGDKESHEGKEWKENRSFIVADITRVEYGNKFDKNKMTRTNPSINFVSRTATNNGISDFVDVYKDTKPFPSGTVTLALGGSIGSCFLQDEPYYTGQNVGVMFFDENVSDRAKLYFTEALGGKCKKSFQAFGNEINKHLKTDLSVSLPIQTDSSHHPVVDPDCKYHPEGFIPDWDYMEKYIRAMEKVVIKDVVVWKDEMIEKTKMVVNGDVA